MELRLQDIDLSLGGKRILNDVSFEIKNKEFVSILGESGAGKSTTLKVISGIVPVDAGQVYFDNECVDALPTFKRDIAMLFQDIRLFPHMSVVENVAFPLKMRKVARAERLRIAKEMLCAVQLPNVGNRRPYELSGGQQQRVALARALAARPRALLLDEPFSGLDEQLRDEMRTLVVRLHDQFEMTSLMVTHDPDEALTMSDRIIYMNEGSVVQIGTPADILTTPANDVVRASFNTPAAIEGVVETGVFLRGKLALPASQVRDGKAVLVRTPDRAAAVYSL